MMDNYPPGVTGFEDAIAGSTDLELTVEHACNFEYDSGAPCDFEGEVDVTRCIWSSSVEDHWNCPECHTDHITDVTERYMEEEEAEREAAYERWLED